MYYEIVINGNSTTPGRALPISLVENLTSLSERMEGKIAITPKSGMLYSLYLYNISSYETLYYFFSKVIDNMKSYSMDVVYSSLHSTGNPPIY